MYEDGLDNRMATNLWESNQNKAIDPVNKAPVEQDTSMFGNIPEESMDQIMALLMRNRSGGGNQDQQDNRQMNYRPFDPRGAYDQRGGAREGGFMGWLQRLLPGGASGYQNIGNANVGPYEEDMEDRLSRRVPRSENRQILNDWEDPGFVDYFKRQRAKEKEPHTDDIYYDAPLSPNS